MSEIVREQFTRYDEELHPECCNKEYLEYRMMGSNEIIAYGYREVTGTSYRWLKLTEVVCDDKTGKQSTAFNNGIKNECPSSQFEPQPFCCIVSNFNRLVAEENMEQIRFDEWARRNRVEENEDCEQCDGIPNANVKGSCYQTMDDMPVECPRLTKLLEEYHKIRAKDELKLERELRIGQPIASTDIKGIDRGHKVGGLTESHLNEGA